jgi:hypothetical protein
MMDWAILLAFAGQYILLVGLFVHHFRVAKRLLVLNDVEIKLANEVMVVSRTNQKILQLIKNINLEEIEYDADEPEADEAVLMPRSPR